MYLLIMSKSHRNRKFIVVLEWFGLSKTFSLREVFYKSGYFLVITLLRLFWTWKTQRSGLRLCSSELLLFHWIHCDNLKLFHQIIYFANNFLHFSGCSELWHTFKVTIQTWLKSIFHWYIFIYLFIHCSRFKPRNE